MQVSVIVTLEVRPTSERLLDPDELAEDARQAVENSCRYFEQALGLPHPQWSEARVSVDSVALLNRD